MKKKILVVGDPFVEGSTFCGMMGHELILRSTPVSIFEFSRAANGREAYDKLLEAPQGELPDLVVVDFERFGATKLYPGSTGAGGAICYSESRSTDIEIATLG